MDKGKKIRTVTVKSKSSSSEINPAEGKQSSEGFEVSESCSSDFSWPLVPQTSTESDTVIIEGGAEALRVSSSSQDVLHTISSESADVENLSQKISQDVSGFQGAVFSGTQRQYSQSLESQWQQQQISESKDLIKKSIESLEIIGSPQYQTVTIEKRSGTPQVKGGTREYRTITVKKRLDLPEIEEKTIETSSQQLISLSEKCFEPKDFTDSQHCKSQVSGLVQSEISEDISLKRELELADPSNIKLETSDEQSQTLRIGHLETVQGAASIRESETDASNLTYESKIPSKSNLEFSLTKSDNKSQEQFGTIAISEQSKEKVNIAKEENLNLTKHVQLLKTITPEVHSKETEISSTKFHKEFILSSKSETSKNISDVKAFASKDKSSLPFKESILLESKPNVPVIPKHFSRRHKAQLKRISKMSEFSQSQDVIVPLDQPDVQYASLSSKSGRTMGIRKISDKSRSPEKQSESSSLLHGGKTTYDPRHNYGCIEPSFDSQSESLMHCEASTSTMDLFINPEDELKNNLKYFLMNPLEKWRAKGKFPWKLVLQIIKIIFVTMQLCIFASDGYIYELQKQQTRSSFQHIFLVGWNSVRDVISYPPSTGPYAVYTKPEFYDNIDHAIKMYANITSLALGTYNYIGPNGTIVGPKFCRDEFKVIKKTNTTLIFNNDIIKKCHTIPVIYPENDPRWDHFSLEKFLYSNNDSISFEKLITAELTFSLKTIFIKSIANIKFPDCYRLNVIIGYDNKQHDGQMLVSLDTNAKELACNHNGIVNPESKWEYTLKQILNAFVIIICILSLLLCVRCLCKARVLSIQVDRYFRQVQNKALTAQEKIEFIDIWYCLIIINDILIICASILKAAIENRTLDSDQYITCAILLGVGNLLVWAGVLRYLGFFRKYNILILTLKRAIPNVLRFMLCCILLYAGFCFCGWVVLGPYHMKFRTLSTTSECLFAMVNGDDLFATFAITNTKSLLIWWFSRIYLYVFISMFIYVVVSLFIAVIMDSYETVKDYYENGCPLSRIQALVAEYPEESWSSFYQQRLKKKKTVWNKLLTFWSSRS